MTPTTAHSNKLNNKKARKMAFLSIGELMLRRLLLPLFISSLFCSIFGQGALAIKSEAWRVGRHDRPDPIVNAFQQKTFDVIISSVPHDGTAADFDSYAAGPSYAIGKDGIPKLTIMDSTKSLTTDFWTLYAIASCPPFAIPSNIPYLPMEFGLVSQKQHPVEDPIILQQRSALAKRVNRQKTAQAVFFPIIPGSFVLAFPNVIGLDTVCDKKNWVGIPIAKLTDKQAIVATDKARGNSVLPTNKNIAPLLNEWPSFFAKHPQPTKEEILAFATELKTKYSGLLKEGEPEAPLP